MATFALTEDDTPADARMWTTIFRAYSWGLAFVIACAAIACAWLARMIGG